MYRPEFFCHSIFTDMRNQHEPERCSLIPIQISDDSFQEDTKPIIHDLDSEASNEYKKLKQQKCNVCDKVLSSASSYYVHMKKHSNNKPYQCTHCDASFCRKPYLEVHMRTHTGEKPFECDVCQKRFTQKSSLNTHKRSHTGVRPFSCDICFKRFSVKSYLEAHKWSHAASNGIACNICHTTFNNKSHYMLHMQTHNSSVFSCDICRKIFAKEPFLIRHKSRMHNNKIINDISTG
ncbi:zinc finger protein 248-like isoform X1 [Diorhabda sublineata]|uniref:zinc finger protein 248-like isoform X1 n=1 Tax=Diorhabda sublineata TaxID=1163346 RepID=UPI0024E067A5|nr:zinc finger protein 248-like isoform X1 [Diorhabda sublineata]